MNQQAATLYRPAKLPNLVRKKPDQGSKKTDSASGQGALGLAGAWAMGVGGMIGGGIFSTLGVVISVAGQWAWASFLLGGLIALATGHCMAALTVDGDRSGGIYRFLRMQGYDRAAHVSALVLLLGYTLTVAVYAYTFGSYLANVFNGPDWLPQAMGVVAIIVLAGLNLRGASDAAGVEIAIVVGKLVILAGLAVAGLWRFDAARLAVENPPGWFGAIVGAASVFMAYEGFELLSYDYDEMADRKTLIRRVMPLTIWTAIVVYIAIALAVPMLVDTSELIADGEVALAKAGQALMGMTGLLLVTAAAAMSTGSAINATLFSSARLAHEVAKEKELPSVFARENRFQSPYIGVLTLGGGAIVLTLLGGLTSLVTGASVVFLLVFGTVNVLAWREKVGNTLYAALGTVGAFIATALLLLHLANVI
ncbi:APC family permease [Altericroceibacterium spongiae]|uniref:APC family permease n=1 Tax=Altericroceibacterium spongiae TaxID=2320269 RepID=A0A420EEY4_9SPHN|nr:APC family permease [Altericroceibacterium spongiae]RKF19257.1 APC family permease [Altericroceibacterium spongiae]